LAIVDSLDRMSWTEE